MKKVIENWQYFEKQHWILVTSSEFLVVILFGSIFYVYFILFYFIFLNLQFQLQTMLNRYIALVVQYVFNIVSNWLLILLLESHLKRQHSKERKRLVNHVSKTYICSILEGDVRINGKRARISGYGQNIILRFYQNKYTASSQLQYCVGQNSDVTAIVEEELS